MTKRQKEDTNTADFEVEAIEEAYAPASEAERREGAKPNQPWKPLELPSLEVERPPELQEPFEHNARICILERRALGFIAKIRRWLVGKARR